MHSEGEIQQYCEIESLTKLWRSHALAMKRHLRWTGKLDTLATARLSGGQQISAEVSATLEDAYRFAFSLCRAKGICDAG